MHTPLNGCQFCDCVVTELRVLWKDVKIFHSKPNHSQMQESRYSKYVGGVDAQL